MTAWLPFVASKTLLTIAGFAFAATFMCFSVILWLLADFLLAATGGVHICKNVLTCGG